MEILKTYISIRLRQLFRVARDAGWGYVLILLPFLAVVILALLDRSLRSGQPITAAVYFLFAASFHFNRRDAAFLSRLPLFPFLFRCLDYTLLSIPFLCGVVVLGLFREVVFLLLGIPLLALLPSAYGLLARQRSWSFSFIPVSAFEWRAGFRRYGWLFLLVYIVTLFAFRLTGAAIVATVLLSIFSVSLFDDLEDKNLLEAFDPPRKFLLKKAYGQGLVFHTLLLPQYILFLAFHTGYWYLLLAVILIAECILLFALFYKYAHWHPQQRKAYNQMATGLYAGGMIVPFLAPASLFYCWLYFRKAQRNLQYYYGQHS